MSENDSDPFAQYFPGGFTIRDEANALAAWAFRNGPLEDLHAGKHSALLDDPELSRITDEENASADDLRLPTTGRAPGTQDQRSDAVRAADQIVRLSFLSSLGALTRHINNGLRPLLRRYY